MFFHFYPVSALMLRSRLLFLVPPLFPAGGCGIMHVIYCHFFCEGIMHDTIPNTSPLASCRELYAPVWDEMLLVEERLETVVYCDDAFTNRVASHGFQLGGKRMRPAVLLLFARAVGEIQPEHILLASALEMIHTASLVHDDILDEAHQRRHMPTVNALWNNETSVLFGDFLVARAIRQVTSLENSDISHCVAEISCRLCEGEMRQVGARGDFGLSEEKYRSIIADKTASLFACACKLGVFAALTEKTTLIPGKEHPLVQAAARFGHHLGMAFQIVDDLLDLSGTEASMGKTLGTDLEKQKITLPVLRLLAQLPPHERAALTVEMQGCFTPELRGEIARRILESGVYEDVRQAARQHLTQAEVELAIFEDSPAKTALSQVAEFVLQRRQ